METSHEKQHERRISSLLMHSGYQRYPGEEHSTLMGYELIRIRITRYSDQYLIENMRETPQGVSSRACIRCVCVFFIP